MPPEEPEIPIKVFISYARADQELHRKLQNHLSPLRHSGKITIWQDQEIPAGANWEDQINTHLKEADLILLLVSAHFIASQYCWNEEIQVALERHKRGEARVIPILLKPVHWQDTPLGQLQTLPTGAKPVTQWYDQDAAFEDVVQGIRRIVEDLLRTSQKHRRRAYKDELRSEKEFLSGPRSEPDHVETPSENASYHKELALPSILKRFWRRFQGHSREPTRSENAQTPSQRAKSVSTPDLQRLPIYQLYEVFVKAGVPHITFVEREDFGLLKLSLLQLGRGIVIEGPSGIGKTTAIKKAIEELTTDLRSSQRGSGINASVSMLSARNPADRDRLKTLPIWHNGTVIIDDFHRLSSAISREIVDYLKYLADTEPAEKKLVVIGIPQSGQTLIDLSFDVATRIDVFRWGKVEDDLILQMIEKGEKALNIRFNRRAEIVLATNGSLNIAQFLCFNICQRNGTTKTQQSLQAIDCNVKAAASRVQVDLSGKFGKPVRHFAAMGGHKNLICVQLLEELAHCDDGFLSLPTLKVKRPDLAGGIEQFLSEKWMDKFYTEYPDCMNHLFFDPSIQALVVDDPQLTFYLNETYFIALAREVGKVMQFLDPNRPKVLVSYSHRDAKWLERLQVHLKPLEQRGIIDLWDDTKIEVGARWKEEIQAAIKSATVAVILVSADFLASDFISEYELPDLLSRARTEGTTILPVIVAPCLFNGCGMDIFQSVNPPDKPLSEMTPSGRERTLAKLAEAISKNLS